MRIETLLDGFDVDHRNRLEIDHFGKICFYYKVFWAFRNIRFFDECWVNRNSQAIEQSEVLNPEDRPDLFLEGGPAECAERVKLLI